MEAQRNVEKGAERGSVNVPRSVRCRFSSRRVNRIVYTRTERRGQHGSPGARGRSAQESTDSRPGYIRVYVYRKGLLG